MFDDSMLDADFELPAFELDDLPLFDVELPAYD